MLKLASDLRPGDRIPAYVNDQYRAATVITAHTIDGIVKLELVGGNRRDYRVTLKYNPNAMIELCGSDWKSPKAEPEECDRSEFSDHQVFSKCELQRQAAQTRSGESDVTLIQGMPRIFALKRRAEPPPIVIPQWMLENLAPSSVDGLGMPSGKGLAAIAQLLGVPTYRGGCGLRQHNRKAVVDYLNCHYPLWQNHTRYLHPIPSKDRIFDRESSINDFIDNAS